MLVFFDGAKKRELSVDDVESVVYQPHPGPQTVDSAAIVLRSSSAVELVRLVNFAEPFEPGGVPGATVSGTITVRVRRLARAWSFTVYGDSLLQDAARPSVFYRTMAGFREALRTLA